MKLERLSKAAVVYALSLTIASLIAYVITYYLLEPFVNQPNDLLGGMWATVATVFVLRDARNLSLRAGMGRFFATCVSCVLTFVYLLLWPFSPVGMAVLIGLGTIVVMLLGRREDVVITGLRRPSLWSSPVWAQPAWDGRFHRCVCWMTLWPE